MANSSVAGGALEGLPAAAADLYNSSHDEAHDEAYDEEELELAEEEQDTLTASAFFVLFAFLLAMVTILSKLLRDRPRLARFVPEAGVILLTGVAFGAVLNLFVERAAASGTVPAAWTDDDRAPAEGEDPTAVAESLLLRFSPEVFFLVLLPPIIFESGYRLKKDLFFRHFVPICLFAIVGTTVSAVVIATLLEAVRWSGALGPGSFRPQFTELLTFGALLSATDPVTTLAVFQEKRVDPHLFYLVFGESVLNDAVGLVLFHSFKYFVTNTNDAEEVVVDVGGFLTGFLYDAVGSPALGVASGLLTALVFRLLDMRSAGGLPELTLLVLVVYVPFLLAELLNLSGIVTILFTGLAVQVYVVPNLSRLTVESADVLFRLAAHLAETAIFLELGLSVFGLKGAIQPAFAAWTALACLVGRAANVYPITYFYNRRLPPDPRRAGGAAGGGGREGLAGIDDPVPGRHIRRHGDAALQGPAEAAVELAALPSHNDGDEDDQNTTGHDQDLSHESWVDGGDLQQEQYPSSLSSGRKSPVVGHLSFENGKSNEETYVSLGNAAGIQPKENPFNMRITSNTAHMLWFSGLRGAVAYACVRSFPDRFGHTNEFTVTTMVIVLASVFCLGSTTGCMLERLNIEMNVDESGWETWCREGRRGGRIAKVEDFLLRIIVRDADHVNTAQDMDDTPTSSSNSVESTSSVTLPEQAKSNPEDSIHFNDSGGII